MPVPGCLYECVSVCVSMCACVFLGVEFLGFVISTKTGAQTTQTQTMSTSTSASASLCRCRECQAEPSRKQGIALEAAPHTLPSPLHSRLPTQLPIQSLLLIHILVVRVAKASLLCFSRFSPLIARFCWPFCFLAFSFVCFSSAFLFFFLLWPSS